MNKMTFHRSCICVFAVLLAFNAATACGAFILSDIPLGQAFYAQAAGSHPTNDTEFFRVPVTTRYATIKYRASWEDSSVAFYVSISREYPRMGSFNNGLERVFNDTEISVVVHGEVGKTTTYFSHQRFLGLNPSYPVTVTISVEPLSDWNVPIISAVPGSFQVLNVTAPQSIFPLAEYNAATQFQDIYVLRATPSFSTRDFKIRPTVQDSNTQEPFTGVGQKLFVRSDDILVDEQATYIVASVPAVSLEFLPNVTYSLNATFFRPMTAFFRTPKVAGKTSSYRAIFRVTSSDDRTSRFQLDVLAGPRRWPIEAYDDGTTGSSASGNGRTEIVDLTQCLRDNANNATYFTIMAYSEDENSYTYDELVAGALSITFEITIQVIFQTPTPLAAGQLLTSATPLAINLTDYPHALATNKVVRITPINSSPYTVGSISMVDPYDSFGSCFLEGPMQSQVLGGILSKFACSLFYTDQVVGVTPRDFSYAITEPKVLNSTVSSFNITIANPFLGRIEGHHALGADVPLPAVIRIVPRKLSGNTDVMLSMLQSRPCKEFPVERYFGVSLRTAVTSAICRDTAYSFSFSGSTALDLQVTGIANMIDVSVPGSVDLQVTVPVGNVTILKLTVPAPVPNRTFYITVNQQALFFAGNCTTGLSQTQGYLYLDTEGFVSISGDVSSETIVTVMIKEMRKGCSPDWTIPSLCTSRIASSSLSLVDDAALQAISSLVNGANSIYNTFFPGQNTTACYNTFMDMSCDSFVPFCVNNIVHSPLIQFSYQCRATLAARGCNTAQVDRLCLQYPGFQVPTLEQMLSGPPMLPPMNPPVNPPMNPPPRAAPTASTSTPSNTPTTTAAVPNAVPSIPATIQPVVAPSLQTVSASSKSVQGTIALLFAVVFASFIAL